MVSFHGHLWACRGRRERQTLIAAPSDFGDWANVKIAGPFVALSIHEESQECSSNLVRVVNTKTRARTTRPASAVHLGDLCSGNIVSDLVLRSDGLVAFIAGTSVVRWSADRRFTVGLEDDPQLDPRSLRFDAGGLAWTVAGNTRRARLPRVKT